MRIVGIILLILAILPIGCTAGAGYWFYTTRQWIAAAETVPGRIVELIEIRDDDGLKWQPRYTYSYDGVAYDDVSSFSSSPKPYEPGEQVDILLDPDDPGDAMIDRSGWNYLFPAIFGILSAVPAIFLLGIGTLFLVLDRHSRTRTWSEPGEETA